MKISFKNVLLSMLLLLSACSVSKHRYNPNQKFGRNQLETDYDISRKILEEKHPSLYWYTSKDSMDYYFNNYRSQIQDSMTETEFTWSVLAPLINKIHCGHTSVEPSKIYEKWKEDTRLITFPYMMRLWKDTMVVTGVVGDDVYPLKRGTIIKSINGIDAATIASNMLDKLSSDGYNQVANMVQISGDFPELHREMFGLSETYSIRYVDSTGKLIDTTISAYFPEKDTAIKKKSSSTTKIKKKKESKYLEDRSLEIDEDGNYAYLKLNTFSDAKLKSFFRRSFASLHEKKIQNLIIDLRYNGGGDVSASTLFTKYITRKPFKVADTVCLQRPTLKPYTKYYEYGMLGNWGMSLISSKSSDNRYHVKSYERILHKPKKRHHYNGKIYILISGPTFSAATLVANAVRGQKDIILIGEETGGGAYGNNGIFIPMATLPNTKIRIRMPLYRVVQFHHRNEEKGRGIIPDVIIPVSHEAITNGYDKKLKVVKEMILNQQEMGN